MSKSEYRVMTISDLKKAIAGLPDDMELVVIDPDDSEGYLTGVTGIDTAPIQSREPTKVLVMHLGEFSYTLNLDADE